MKRERLSGGSFDDVEVDHTELDVIVADPKSTLPIGRPRLTIRVCTYSKRIVGFCLCPAPVQASNNQLVVTRRKEKG
jgi:hypothetical protein